MLVGYGLVAYFAAIAATAIGLLRCKMWALFVMIVFQASGIINDSGIFNDHSMAIGHLLLNIIMLLLLVFNYNSYKELSTR